MSTSVEHSSRFDSLVQRTGACWHWLGRLSVGGYGQFRFGGSMRYAHRVSFAMAGGIVADGLELDHLCRNRACVNPAHLEPVTRAENCRRGRTGHASGSQKKAKTHCPRGHSYADAYTSKGHRVCRGCALENSKRQKARAKARKG